MSGDALQQFGRGGLLMRSPIADVGKLPQTVFVVEFQEANAEWGRPHSANPMLAS